MSLCRIGPYKCPEEGQQPSTGTYLISSGGSLYLVLIARLIARQMSRRSGYLLSLRNNLPMNGKGAGGGLTEFKMSSRAPTGWGQRWSKRVNRYYLVCERLGKKKPPEGVPVMTLHWDKRTKKKVAR